jgi:uncharacterized RDD family membrane protein YckC
MEWYYASDGKQSGPVSDDDFQKLVGSGQIAANTLVWREGMPSWQAYSAVRAGTGEAAGSLAVCVECGRAFPPEDMLQYGSVRVCAACKPIFFQKLKQGADVTHTFVYGGFWLRVVAKLIDGVILWIVNMGTNVLGGMLTQGANNEAMSGVFFIFYFMNIAVGAAYEAWFLGKFGATPGKMALGLRVIRPDGEKITYLRALGRHFAEMISGLILGIGYIMAAFDEEKRALHDRICDTRVIKV